MMKRKTRRLAAAGAAVCAIGGLGAAALGTGAAQASGESTQITGSTESTTRSAGTTPAEAQSSHPVADRPGRDGLASMSSPYVPDVMHLPATVGLALGPGGDLKGARYLAPKGSVFDGPVTEVDARAQALWDEYVAAGATPEQADRMLAELVD